MLRGQHMDWPRRRHGLNHLLVNLRVGEHPGELGLEGRLPARGAVLLKQRMRDIEWMPQTFHHAGWRLRLCHRHSLARRASYVVYAPLRFGACKRMK